MFFEKITKGQFCDNISFLVYQNEIEYKIISHIFLILIILIKIKNNSIVVKVFKY